MANAPRSRTAPEFREILRLDTLRRGRKTLEFAITAVANGDAEEHEYFSLVVRDETNRPLATISIRPNELLPLACALTVARDYLTRRTYRPRKQHRPSPNEA